MQTARLQSQPFNSPKHSTAKFADVPQKNFAIHQKNRNDSHQVDGYNKGYNERIKTAENSPFFFRSPSETENIMASLHNINFRIRSMETVLRELLERFRTSTASSLFDEDLWSTLASQQLELVHEYSEFLFLASTPSKYMEFTKSLVSKYQIPTRLWNDGISVFVELLRSRSPASNNVLIYFVIQCINQLMLFVDPIYDTRHLWIESLGDLSLICLMTGDKTCGNWQDMCMYWYQRRAFLTPGTGRLYRKMATVSEVNIDSLFLICKNLTALQPMNILLSDIVSILDRRNSLVV